MVSLPDSNYSALLQEYLGRATHQALSETRDPSPGTERLHGQTALLHTLTLALHAPEHWQDARDLLFQLHARMEKDGRYTGWDEVLRQGLVRSKAMGDRETGAILQIYLGTVYRMQGQSAEALALFLEALDDAEQTLDGLWYVRACNGLAWTLRLQGRWAEAGAWVQRALDRLPAEEVNERAGSYRILGGVAMERRDWQEAFRLFEEALRLWREGADPRLIAFGLQNLGSALRALKRYDEAESALLEAVDYFDAAGDLYHGGITRISVGNLFLMRGQFARAIEAYSLAERIFRTSRDEVRLAGIYNNWGMAYAGLAQWSEAVKAYHYSLTLWERAGDIMNQANAMDNLSIALYHLGRYQESADICRAALSAISTMDNPPLVEELELHLAQAEAQL